MAKRGQRMDRYSAYLRRMQRQLDMPMSTGRRRKGQRAEYVVWPTEPYGPSAPPAPAGTVFGWAEALVRSLVDLQLEQRLYGGSPYEQVDYTDGCQLCAQPIVRDTGRIGNIEAARTKGGWVACRRCRYRLRALERLGHYAGAVDPFITDDTPPRRHDDDT